MKKRLNKISSIILISLLASCSGGEGTVGTSAGNPTYFPSNLAVASPFDTTDETAESVNARTLTKNQSRDFSSRYGRAVERIDNILSGDSTTDCRFNTQLFLTQDTDAGCYGPTVKYEGHPDYNGELPPGPQEDGELPIGDVGLWIETDDETGHACAAAQLNSRLESMHDRSLAALMGLASLVCAANVNGIDLPDNSSLNLAFEMNTLGVVNTTFNTATITHTTVSGNDQWAYELNLDFTRNSTPFEITVSLTHTPGSDDNYQGRLSYQVNDSRDPPGNCPSADQTYNGSLLYNRSSDSGLNVEVRGALFCEHDSNGLTDGVVDPDKKFNGGADPNGWANNFSTFTADLDPDSLAGNYAYSWQAGSGDGYTRVLNAIVTEADDSPDNLSGEAFYGFGDDIAATDGAITGFFCNWAGPNGRQTFQALAQNQTMSLNSSTGKFEADSSNITYAPVNACNYNGTGSFTYDSNADGNVDTNPATAITHNLIQLADADGNGIFDAVEESGFELPTAPENI